MSRAQVFWKAARNSYKKGTDGSLFIAQSDRVGTACSEVNRCHRVFRGHVPCPGSAEWSWEGPTSITKFSQQLGLLPAKLATAAFV